MTGENLDSTASLDELSSSPRSSIFLDNYLLHDGEKSDPSRGGDDKIAEETVQTVRLQEFVESIPSLVARYNCLPRCDDGTGPLSKPVLDLFRYVFVKNAAH
jgi:hypothetical protein